MTILPKTDSTIDEKLNIIVTSFKNKQYTIREVLDLLSEADLEVVFEAIVDDMTIMKKLK